MPEIPQIAKRTWEELIRDIDVLLSGDEVEIEAMRALLATYESNPADWSKYALFDPYKYTRNLVSAGNGKYNLLVLAWDVGKARFALSAGAGIHTSNSCPTR